MIIAIGIGLPFPIILTGDTGGGGTPSEGVPHGAMWNVAAGAPVQNAEVGKVIVNPEV